MVSSVRSLENGVTARSLCKFYTRAYLPSHFRDEQDGRSSTLSETRGLAAKVRSSCRVECH